METELRPLKFKCHDNLRRLTDDYWQRAYRAKEEGKYIAWCSAMVPSDILSAMDFFLVFAMNNSATSGSRHVSLDLCEVAEAEGYSPDLCSYAKTDIGSALMGAETKNPLRPPKPDIILVGNGQCHTISKWLESLGHIFNVPVISVDVPYLHDGFDADTYARGQRYVVDQLQEIITYLEGFTDSRFSYDRLEECVDLSGRMFRTWKNVFELCQNIPSPMSVFDIFTHLFPVLGFRATAEGVAYYEELKSEVAERVAQGVSAIPQERFRVHLDGVPTWFNLRGLYSRLASYGACPITHVYPLIFNYESLDSARPLESTADCFLGAYANRGIRQRTDILAKVAVDFHLDGLVMQMSRTCKAITVPSCEIAQGVERITGLPYVVYETDMCDPRLHSEAQLDTRLQAFMEVLEHRTARR